MERGLIMQAAHTLGAAMAPSAPQDINALPLPPLRQDLRLIEGGAADAHAGQSAQWRIHDPVAQRFYNVDRYAVDMLAHWDQRTIGRMRAAVAKSRSEMPSEQEVTTLLNFLQRNELLEAVPMQTFARVRQHSQALKRSLGSHLLHGYLFIKLPLARPDAFLRRTLPLVSVFFTPAFWIAMAVLGTLGLYLVSRQWDQFLATFPDMFSVSGVVTYALSLALVKTLHELGHGYTAVRQGSRITTMGVAFVVMTPILYTDTTDAWRLPKRSQRVMIDAAGMAVEVAVAVVATLAWVFLPDGGLRHAAFALATAGWVMSLAVNMNPLMRFDGYYLFSDLTGYPNLQERSFAMGRWFLRELLFGYGDEQPEPAHGRSKLFLIGFAYATWVYRFFLFLGIALLVYHYFFKLLGIFLFAVEIGWFLFMPIWNEVKVWHKRKGEAGSRLYITAALLAVLAAVLLVPMPYMVRIPAMLTAANQAPAFAPQPARIDAIRVHQGDKVRAGQLLMQLSVPEIDQQLQNSRDQAVLLHRRLDRRGADERDLSDSLVLASQLRLEGDRIGGLERQRDRLAVRAPIDGVVVELAPELKAGRWVDDKTMLALVAQPGNLEVRGYVDADDLKRIQTGDTGEFKDERHLQAPRDIRIERIGAAASEELDHWELAANHGGPVPARALHNRAMPEHAVFEVSASAASLASGPLVTELRGEMQVRGAPQSLAMRALRRVLHVLVREAGA